MNNKALFPLTLVFFLTLSTCSEKNKSITPEIKSITESVYATGFIKSKNQYEVYGKINELIEKIFVTEGMTVRKGDPIFQLYDKNLKIATQNARLASTAASYAENKDKLLDAKKAIELAEKNLLNDSIQYIRQKNLWAKNIGSQVELELKQLNFEKSKTDLAKAKTSYEDLQRQLQLASDQSKNNLEIAQLLEENYMIRSEVDGVVYKINREEGELINGQGPAAIIGTDEFVIELNIDEMDIVKVKTGQQVIIRMDSYKSQVFEARIVAIDPMMNTRTRSFEAEAIFTKRPDELFPNLTVEANIVILSKQEALTIPRNYLINDSCVMLEGGKLISVRTGLMDYDLVEITGGIDQTTRIELPR